MTDTMTVPTTTETQISFRQFVEEGFYLVLQKLEEIEKNLHQRKEKDDVVTAAVQPKTFVETLESLHKSRYDKKVLCFLEKMGVTKMEDFTKISIFDLLTIPKIDVRLVYNILEFCFTNRIQLARDSITADKWSFRVGEEYPNAPWTNIPYYRRCNERRDEFYAALQLGNKDYPYIARLETMRDSLLGRIKFFKDKRNDKE